MINKFNGCGRLYKAEFELEIHVALLGLAHNACADYKID
jgi:hypothetical protein